MKECEGGVLKLKEGLEVEVKALEGEEEADFLEKAQGSINERRAKGGKNHQRGRRGGGRGGRGHRGEATYFMCVRGFILYVLTVTVSMGRIRTSLYSTR